MKLNRRLATVATLSVLSMATWLPVLAQGTVHRDQAVAPHGAALSRAAHGAGNRPGLHDVGQRHGLAMVGGFVAMLALPVGRQQIAMAQIGDALAAQT